MQKLLLSLGLVALLLPALTSAATCPNLYRNLSIGMSGSDVRELQVFLIETRDLATGNTTGYFGNLTRAAVRSFQCREMGICSGSEAANGYGRVGPKTREAIQRVCSSTATSYPVPIPSPTNSQCSMSVSPASITLGLSSLLTWSSTNANYGTISGIGTVAPHGSQTIYPTQTATYTGTFWGHQAVATCSATIMVASLTTSSNPSFSASPTSGEAPLAVTFTVNPGDAAPSTFYVDFGDGSTGPLHLLSCGAPEGVSCPQVYTVSHTYAAVGTYIAKLKRTVSSQVDNLGVATITVTAPRQICEHANPPVGCYWQPGATCAQDQLICPTANASCPLDGVTVPHGQTRKFYQQRVASSWSMCQTFSIDRTCNNGVLSGATSYQYASCTATDVESAPAITITSPQSGASIARGSVIGISWQGQNAPAGSIVRLSMVSTDGLNQYVLTATAPTSGSFNYTVPTDMPLKSFKLYASLAPSPVSPDTTNTYVLVTVTGVGG
ncbi:MAG: OmpA/MotB domain-containing protein [Parcubacteria group bacterium Gr01-1014_8]|nr:MAG: OmpA/MotB domain-containing protein [Parcubacteria group bacterium Gr01-1014_8]